jgi:choline dehydrogenase-like flavoprotein
MIRNLTGVGTTHVDADFLIIGAGTIGIPVAALLAKQLNNKKVIVLESGDRKQLDTTHPLNSVVMHSDHYTAAHCGRFRCLGGTSSRWGGALIPFQSSDLLFEGWPTNLPCLEKYIPQVEAIFGLEKGDYEDTEFPFSLTDDFVVRSAKWPPMKNLNVYSLFYEECTHRPNLSIWINATATKINTKHSGHVEISAQSPGRDTIHVSANRVIIAAGAIETTRLALLIDQQNNKAISKISPNLGHYFSDHISVPIATIKTNDTSNLNRVFGFHFVGKGLIRKPRIEMANDTKLRNRLPPSYIHIEPQVNEPSGFDALREYYKSMQMQKRPTTETFTQLLKHTPWLIQAFWWRYVNKRLLFPSHANIEIHVVIQQNPDRNNRITLSNTETDIFNIPLAEIEWNIGSMDINNILQTTRAYERIWKYSNLSSLGEWSSFDRSFIIDNAVNNEGYHHPTSSTKMADNPVNGVVDTDLRLFPFPRIQLLSTSVLPSGGGANPTMMLMCLGLRCVDQLIEHAFQHPENRTPYKEKYA